MGNLHGSVDFFCPMTIESLTRALDIPWSICSANTSSTCKTSMVTPVHSWKGIGYLFICKELHHILKSKLNILHNEPTKSVTTCVLSSSHAFRFRCLIPIVSIPIDCHCPTRKPKKRSLSAQF